MVVAETDTVTHHGLHGKTNTEREDVDMETSLSTCMPQEAFTCNQCMETFVDRDILFKHVKMEHKQHVYARRRFKCEQCQRTFKSMTGLRNHARTHSTFYQTQADSSLFDLTSVSTEQSNTTLPCSMDSTFIVEASVDTNNLEKTVTQESVKEEIETRDKCDRLQTESQRRRSGIPIAVRSLLPENRSGASGLILGQKFQNESNEEVEQLNSNSEHAPTKCASFYPTSSKDCETRRSKRVARGFKIELTQDQKNEQRVYLFKSRTPRSYARTPNREGEQNDYSKVEHKSPFGVKFRTKLGTPRSRSRSKKRTPHDSKRTPNNKSCTPVKGRRILADETRTPVNNRTPRSAKKDTPTCKVYNCKKCGKSFVDRAKLEVHFAVHIRDTPEKCGIPKYALKKTPISQKNDAREIKEDTCVRNCENFSCQQCGRTYEKKTYLDAHMKIHDVNTPFKCDHCDKRFRYMSSLKAHSFVHQGESRDFLNSFTLDKGNTTLYSKAQPLQLDISKTAVKFNIFSVLETEDNSLEDFLNDLPFTCKTCSFKTHAPAELLAHMKTHSRSGLFPCKLCNKSYTLQSNLRRHEKIHAINRLKEILIENANCKVAE